MKHDNDNTMLALMVAGAVLLYIGLPLFVEGSLAYPNAKRADDEMRKKAQEIGLQEIPGVDGTATFFLTMAVVGGAMTTGGVVFISLALYRQGKHRLNASMVGKGAEFRKPLSKLTIAKDRALSPSNSKVPHKVAIEKMKKV